MAGAVCATEAYLLDLAEARVERELVTSRRVEPERPRALRSAATGVVSGLCEALRAVVRESLEVGLANAEQAHSTRHTVQKRQGRRQPDLIRVFGVITNFLKARRRQSNLYSNLSVTV